MSTSKSKGKSKGKSKEKVKEMMPSSIYSVMELDFRPIFASGAGDFFREKIKKLGWDKMWGGDGWFFRPSLVQYFKDNLVIDGKGDMAVKIKQGHTTTNVQLTPEIIATLSGIPLNSDYTYADTFGVFAELNFETLLNQIAPYRQPTDYNSSEGYVKAIAFQKNTMACVKWVTINLIGSQNLHRIRVKAVWLTCVIADDKIPQGFCLCRFILNSLQKYMDDSRSYPLPSLVTRLMCHILGLEPDYEIDHGFKKTVVSTILKCKISGLWNGVVLTGDDRPRFPASTSQAATDFGGDDHLMEDATGDDCPPLPASTSQAATDVAGDDHSMEDDAIQQEAQGQGALPEHMRVSEMLPIHYRTFGNFHNIQPDDRMEATWNQLTLVHAYLHDLYEKNDWAHPSIPGYNDVDPGWNSHDCDWFMDDDAEGSRDRLDGGNGGDCQRKLLILDLNGLLFDIVDCNYARREPDLQFNRKRVYKRPHLEPFLEFCFQKFEVAVWTSRLRKNAQPVIDEYFRGKKLVFFWDQLKCIDVSVNLSTPLFVKPLTAVWKDFHCYNNSNTVSLDDSPNKATRNPLYTGIPKKVYTFSHM